MDIYLHFFLLFSYPPILFPLSLILSFLVPYSLLFPPLLSYYPLILFPSFVFSYPPCLSPLSSSPLFFPLLFSSLPSYLLFPPLLFPSLVFSYPPHLSYPLLSTTFSCFLLFPLSCLLFSPLSCFLLSSYPLIMFPPPLSCLLFYLLLSLVSSTFLFSILSIFLLFPLFFTLLLSSYPLILFPSFVFSYPPCHSPVSSSTLLSPLLFSPLLSLVSSPLSCFLLPSHLICLFCLFLPS